MVRQAVVFLQSLVRGPECEKNIFDAPFHHHLPAWLIQGRMNFVCKSSTDNSRLLAALEM